MNKISVIIPCYNSYNTINRLLDTIPKSLDIEVIVIDDRSEDIEKIKSIIEKYEGVIFLVNNTGIKGAGKCRNIGLGHATGDWLVFADSDDYFLCGAFEVINKKLNKDVDVIYFTPTSTYDKSGELADRHVYLANLVKNGKKAPNDLRYKFFVPWSKVIKRSFIIENRIMFDEVIASNDILFSVKLGHFAKKIKALSDVIYCVTRGSGTLTVNYSRDVRLSRYSAVIRLNKFLAKYDVKEYQSPLIAILFNYFRIMSFNDFCKLLVESLSKGWKILPPPTSMVRKLTSYDSKKDKKYTK